MVCFCLFLKWCDVTDITPTLSKAGHRCIVCAGYNMRLAHTGAKGELSWRCSISNRGCSARVKTDADVTKIIKFKGVHNHLNAEQKQLQKELMSKRKKLGNAAPAQPGYIIDDDYKMKETKVSSDKRGRRPAAAAADVDITAALSWLAAKPRTLTKSTAGPLLMRIEPSRIISRTWHWIAV